MADDGYYNDAEQTRAPPAFILVPLNTAARKATEHVKNKYWQYQHDNNMLGLWIEFTDPSKEDYTLGRGDNVDIFLPESVGSRGSAQIAHLHASFVVVAETGAVLLHDHSKHRNTEPFSASNSFTVKFHSNASSVLVAQGINSRIAFGRDRYYQFEIQWRSDGLYDFPRKDEPYVMGPRESRHKKYVQGDKVGGGAYGNVWRVLDVTTGTFMAVKKFHNLSGKNLEFATREVANLFRINKDKSIQHEHILQIYDYAGGGARDNWGEIFMPLMSGNLKTLVERTEDIDDYHVADLVLRQMLLALQCIASHKIVHRDIKPENILWVTGTETDYHFCLGDFGLSNDPNIARTVAGTEPFMAPEVFQRKAQSTKVDIWSLFATVVWVRNTDQFRGMCGQLGAQQIHSWLASIARGPGYENIRTMASINPKKRPSASQQLVILDTGDYEIDPGHGDIASGDEGADDLELQFDNLNLEDDLGSYGQGSGSMASPEMPYYEPYTTGLMENYPWEAEAGPSKKYMPPPDAPRVDQNPWPTYGADPYDPAGAVGGGTGDSGEGTAVPDMWTQRPLMTEEDPSYYNPREPSRRKHKGKQKH